MRLRKLSLPAVALCAALGTAIFAPAQTKIDPAEIAFQAAIKAETVDGDLKGAIGLYQKLAAGGNRAVAARSLVRMGQCYEKLGDQQARAAYDRVVRDFADQPETVAAALGRLAVLDRPEPGSPLLLRKVWAAPEANADGAPSPDGRILSFTDRTSGNIALRDLSTGETRLLTKNSDRRQRPGDRSLISPDGKTVAFAWIDGNGTVEVRLIGLDGSGGRILFRDPRLTGAELGAWSPDGARIAAALTLRNAADGVESCSVALLAVRDGSVRLLKNLGPRRPEPRGFSPDGRLIACAFPPADDAESRDIYLLAADGSGEMPLVEHPADDQLLGWTPDGKGILFTSDRALPRGLWFLPMANNKAAGAAVLVKADIGDIVPLGFLRAGAFVYGAETGPFEAYTAGIDSGSGRFAAPPTLINPRSSGANQYPMFSPDGRSLSYLTRGPGEIWILRVRALETGAERDFPIGRDIQVLRKPRWTADGRGIIVSGHDKEYHHVGFYLIDLSTSTYDPLLSSNPQAETMGGEFAPDGKSLFLARTGAIFADRATRILRRDAVTAEEREIYAAPPGADITDLALSPDGRTLVFSVRTPNGIRSFDDLMVMPVDSRAAAGILRLEGRESIRRDGLAWTPDGSTILFVRAVETSRYASILELWSASPLDGEARRIGVMAEDTPAGADLAGLRVHPDGISVAFQAVRHRPEVWMMEGFKPAPRPPAFLNLEYELSVEAWIYPTGLGQQCILAKGNYNYEGVSYGLSLTADGRIRWGTRHGHDIFGESGDWSIDGIVADTPLRTNTWYHVACTLYAGKSASIFVNGALVKTGPITQTIPSRPSEPLHVGSLFYFGMPTFPYNGMIDDVAVYDRALSAEEILERFLTGLPRHKEPAGPPAAASVR